MKKFYQAPNVIELGSVRGLTQGDPEDIDYKCSGSGDFLDPNENSNRIEEEMADC